MRSHLNRMTSIQSLRTLDFVTASYYTSTTAISAVTFAGVSLGAAAADRIIIVGVYAGATASRTISGVTLGGTSMSLLSKVDNGLTMAGWYYLVVPSGTSADVVATFSSTVSPAAVVVYRLANWNPAGLLDSSAAFGTAAARSATVNTAQNGSVLVIGANYTGGSSSTGSVSNLGFEDANTALRVTTRFIAGHSNRVPAGSLTCGITYSGAATVNSPLVVASLR